MVGCGMQVIALPDRVRGVIFDIDGTLYDNDTYARGQISVLVERLAQHRGEPVDQTWRSVESWRDRHQASHGVRQSIGNTFLAFGIPIETSVRWREELIHPELYLDRDERLRETLLNLSVRYALLALTNNPVSVGRRTLEVLGVEDLIPVVVGLDTTLKSKPETAPFLAAAERVGISPAELVSVGDRNDVDIEPARRIGMGAILVDNVRDVYELVHVLP